jgi:hypothetical protein
MIINATRLYNVKAMGRIRPLAPHRYPQPKPGPGHVVRYPRP